MNAHRSLYSGVVISQPKNDNYNQYYISKILEECSTNKDTSRKVNDKDACCPASAPKCGYSGTFFVCTIQVHPLGRPLVDLA
jgi:hypothetical protein